MYTPLIIRVWQDWILQQKASALAIHGAVAGDFGDLLLRVISLSEPVSLRVVD